MSKIDLDDMQLLELSRNEFSLVRDICEAALDTTFMASSPDTDRPDGEGGPDLSEDMFFDRKGIAYKVAKGHEVIGGIFIRFVPAESRAVVELFGLREDVHGKGLGRRILKMVEEIHSDIRVWELFSPVFALRNVAFYVNKCGYHIVEIMGDEKTRQWEMFRFEKIVTI